MQAMTDPVASAPDPLRSRFWWSLFLGWWTVLALLFTAQVYLRGAMRDREVPLSEALVVGFLDAYTWGVLAVAAFWLARRVPLERGHLARAVVVHLAAAAVLVVARLYFFALIGPYILSHPGGVSPLERLIGAGPTNLLAYLLLAGVGCTLEYFRRYRARELAAAQLEEQVARTHLQALTNHLQPGFLFSSLRTLSALMHRDVRAADRMLALLGDLLRLTLQKGAKPEVTLREELELMELYLEIEQARFGEQLRVEWQIEPEALEACVPHLILQPLVASAIGDESGTAVFTDCIVIRAWRAAERLALEVGTCRAGVTRPARPQPAVHGGEIAIAAAVEQTRHRLTQLYDAAYHVEVEAASGGLVARLTLPYLPYRHGGATGAAPAATPATASATATDALAGAS